MTALPVSVAGLTVLLVDAPHQLHAVPRHVCARDPHGRKLLLRQGYVGTLAMTGKLKPEDLKLRHRTKQQTLAEAIRESGFDPEACVSGKPLADLKKFGAFIELHIEQGRRLTAIKRSVSVLSPASAETSAIRLSAASAKRLTRAP